MADYMGWRTYNCIREVSSTSNGSWSGDPTQGGVWQAGEEVTREITETVETQTRTGVTTSVVEDFV